MILRGFTKDNELNKQIKSESQKRKENNMIITIMLGLVIVCFLTILVMINNVYQNKNIDSLSSLNFSYFII